MREEEAAMRITIVQAMFSTIGYETDSIGLAGFVRKTARIPIAWLRIACAKLEGRWDSPYRPKPVDVRREALRRAGFRSYNHPSGHGAIEPDLERIRWWPPPGVKLPLELADQWHRPASEITGAAELGLLLPSGEIYQPALPAGGAHG